MLSSRVKEAFWIEKETWISLHGRPFSTVFSDFFFFVFEKAMPLSFPQDVRKKTDEGVTGNCTGKLKATLISHLFLSFGIKIKRFRVQKKKKISLVFWLNLNFLVWMLKTIVLVTHFKFANLRERHGYVRLFSVANQRRLQVGNPKRLGTSTFLEANLKCLPRCLHASRYFDNCGAFEKGCFQAWRSIPVEEGAQSRRQNHQIHWQFKFRILQICKGRRQ